jgi:hypothetical protein
MSNSETDHSLFLRILLDNPKCDPNLWPLYACSFDWAEVFKRSTGMFKRFLNFREIINNPNKKDSGKSVPISNVDLFNEALIMFRQIASENKGRLRTMGISETDIGRRTIFIKDQLLRDNLLDTGIVGLLGGEDLERLVRDKVPAVTTIYIKHTPLELQTGHEVLELGLFNDYPVEPKGNTSIRLSRYFNDEGRLEVNIVRFGFLFEEQLAA